MGIILKNAPVNVYHFIGMVEHYYNILRQVYFIIIIEISDIQTNLKHQIFFKAMNNLVSLHGQVSTLLVFGAETKII